MTSIIAVAPAAASARPAAIRGSARAAARRAAAAAASATSAPSSGCSSSISPAAAPPNDPGHADRIGGLRSGPADHQLGRVGDADRGHRDGEDRRARSGRRRGSPRRSARPARRAVAELERVVAPEVLGDADPDVELGGLGAHRREVAERRAGRLAADRARRAPAAPEGDPVDDRVDADRPGAPSGPTVTAASSPIPIRTSALPAREPSRSRIAAIRSNSGELRIRGSLTGSPGCR